MAAQEAGWGQGILESESKDPIRAFEAPVSSARDFQGTLKAKSGCCEDESLRASGLQGRRWAWLDHSPSQATLKARHRALAPLCVA